MSRQTQILNSGISLYNGSETYDIVLSETIKLIKTQIDSANNIDKNSSLMHDLDLDSVEVMELIESFEDKFDVEIPIDRLPEMETVDDLVRLIYPLIQEKSEQ